MPTTAHFTPELFGFLRELRNNNNREWFQANKHRYESAVRDAMLRFIMDFASHLEQISRHLLADLRPTGGSMFRIYRDTRFSKDKSPYKTHLAAHFPHRKAGEYVHAPVFYLHLEPDNCFAGAGLWHPDSRALTRVRDAIVGRPETWKKACRGLTLEGKSLRQPPRGYDPRHPLTEDLKRKDFITSMRFTEAEVCSPKFLRSFVLACSKMSPLVQFLSRALGLAW